MTTIEIKKVICQHCNKCYPATKDNFYTAKGKLKLNSCKGCKKNQSQERRKTIPEKKRDRKEYMKLYQREYRLKKKIETLNSKDSKDI
jgi:flavoprotein